MAPQEHDWIAMVVYNLSHRQAKAMSEGPIGPPTYGEAGGNPEVLPDGRANLRIEDVIQDRTAVGCYRCEQPYGDEVAGKPCPGEPIGYAADGEPRYA